ncbi:Phosphotransferase enzyme family protein [Salinihabitans flavidus]|uniref:Phosphotransferase enzyme family protein n=1 Tax=Salinihabitans flavidus TaxID=569882 RepID=A0A1H8LP91_9RHOB|nr:aminoglycoside phosphotransferase family protein [Salinihabitans flavidus]SEO06939.1 Phosphotransferase enzyme family protein [Salinihabitans flavidus]
MLGGRTNRAWQITGREGQAVAVKLYSRKSRNPMFPNDPMAEAALLRHLSGTGLVPRLLVDIPTPLGICLVYTMIPGTLWRSDVDVVAATVRRLHRLRAPSGLRKAPDGSAEIAYHTELILDLCSSGQDLQEARPRMAVPPCGQKALLHGDIVPGNLIANESGLYLIDWQCPAIGDPCEDIGVFLSPAMQHLYRGHVLSPAEEAQFLDAYADTELSTRYQKLAPWYHWRMAAYCLWQVENGREEYGAGLKLEWDALQRSLSA